MKEERVIRIGTRESRLAMWQAEYVARQIRTSHPEIKVELVPMTTTGDKILHRALDQVGGKGLFVKELDLALREKRTDLSVHSLKDVPMEIPEDLPLLAFTGREDPRDAVIFRDRHSKEDTGRKLRIGTSSSRRRIQLQELYPNADFPLIRGNVQTRLQKVESGEYDGTVLAMAGLKRLGLEDRADRILEPEEMLPAAGQGILAIQGRAGENYSFLEEIDDEDSRAEALAERAFIKVLQGGCSAPSAAYAKVDAKTQTLWLRGMYCPQEGMPYLKGERKGTPDQAEALGKTLAECLKERYTEGD